MICPKCSAELADGAVFCHKCGERANSDQPGEVAGVSASQAVSAAVGDRLTRANTDSSEEEEKLWSGGYSAKAMIGTWTGAVVMTIILVVIGIANTVGLPITFVAVLVLWCALGLLLAYRKLRVSYELTNRRFVHRVGFLHRVTDRIEAIDMDDVTFEQGIVQRMLNVGTIRILSSDRSHPKLILLGIDDVESVAKLIDDTRHKERMRRSLHIEAV